MDLDIFLGSAIKALGLAALFLFFRAIWRGVVIWGLESKLEDALNQIRELERDIEYAIEANEPVDPILPARLFNQKTLVASYQKQLIDLGGCASCNRSNT